jgi:outer membrane immunogenic protein
MKKLLLLSVAVAALGAGAAAGADLPVKAPWRPTCPAPWFAGAYAGVNGGAVLWTANRTDQDGVIIDTTTVGQKTVGGIVGGQVGYNWTRCNTLFGIEVDGDWSSAKVTTRFLPNTPGVDVNVTSRFDGLVTGRARAGVVLDDFLLYVTGGIAGGHFGTTWTNFTPPVLLQADIGEWAWGWVAGFGTEWAWSDRMTLRAETLYIDFVDREHNVPTLLANFTHVDSMWLTRVGVNVKFGGPLVAAY